MRNPSSLKPKTIALFIVDGEKIALKDNTEYNFIGEIMTFYLDEDDIINSSNGHQWTINDFAKEVNITKSFPKENS